MGALSDDLIGKKLRADDLNNSLRDLLRACIQARCADNISAVFLGMESDGVTDVLPRVEPVTEPHGVVVRGSLFSGFDEAEKIALSDYVEEITVDRDHRFVSEGDPADSVYVVLEGTVHLHRGRVPLGEVSNGVVGEIGFTRDAIQSVAAVAQEPTRMIVVRRDRFQELLSDQPGLAARVAMAISDAQSERVRSLGDRLSSVEQALRGTR
ncbi:MAG: CRP-like cAMP-binding protein [Kiritimatiellia bacterium]